MSLSALSDSFEYIDVLWVYGHYKYVYSYSAGIHPFSTSESDVCRGQILMTKVDPRPVSVKIVCDGQIEAHFRKSLNFGNTVFFIIRHIFDI